SPSSPSAPCAGARLPRSPCRLSEVPRIAWLRLLLVLVWFSRGIALKLGALLASLLAQACFCIPDFTGGVARCKIRRLEQRRNLDLAVLIVRIGAALDPLQSFVHGLHLPEPVPGD